MVAFRFRKINLKKYNWGKLGLELLVVFLGVSSGFLLNNWRERQQEQKLEQKYIKGFLKDVGANEEQLKKMIAADSLWLDQSTQNVLAMRGDSLLLDSAEAVTKKIIGINRVQFYEGTYRDITNSGNLNIIRDFELRSGIVDYQIALNDVRFVDDYFYQFFNDFVMPFVLANFDVLTASFKDESSYRTLEFSNVFVGYYAMVQQRRKAYSDLLDKSRSFKELLLSMQKEEVVKP